MLGGKPCDAGSQGQPEGGEVAERVRMVEAGEGIRGRPQQSDESDGHGDSLDYLQADPVGAGVVGVLPLA